MSEAKSRSSDLVTTRAELPPGIDAPSPPGRGAGTVPDEVERELRRLAERVGGMARLRELVTALAAGDR
jgi:hypothetical protein